MIAETIDISIHGVIIFRPYFHISNEIVIEKIMKFGHIHYELTFIAKLYDEKRLNGKERCIIATIEKCYLGLISIKEMLK